MGVVVLVLTCYLPICAVVPNAIGATDTENQTQKNGPHLVLEAGGHLALIGTLIFTADGRELVSVSDDKTIRVWSVSPDGSKAELSRTIRGQIEEAGPVKSSRRPYLHRMTKGVNNGLPWAAFGRACRGPQRDPPA